jgi:DNA-binding NarL/FixJ family response regulator
MNAPGTRKIRVLLADDHNIMRTGIRVLLERQPDFEVVGEAGDGREAAAAAAALSPDVVVIDVAMPRLNGLDATRQITSKNPATAVVILSMHADEGYVARALKAGAKGYLLKDSAEADLLAAIRAVHQGKAFFSPEISRMLADDFLRQLREKGAEDSYELLTMREREVLHLLAEGRSNKEAAGVLNLSLNTVETHRANIMEKLHLRGTPELILYAVRKGVIS